MTEPKEIGIFESKMKLSELVRRVLAGESFYITRRGQRVAELRPVTKERIPLVRGCAKNPGYVMAEDFDEPLEDLKEYM
jgi:antitoxin (DNA-binding transcriptional repressor) of toxin-antitoxin stability system